MFEFFKCRLHVHSEKFNFRLKKSINTVTSAALVMTKLVYLSKHKTHFFFWPGSLQNGQYNEMYIKTGLED